MRTTRVVSVTLPLALFEQAQAMAKAENRTMSELMREALRFYHLERIFAETQAHMQAMAPITGVYTEEDVVRVVKEFRHEQSQKALEALAEPV